MRRGTVAAAVAYAAASALVLSACASPAPLPPAPTDAERRALIQEAGEARWPWIEQEFPAAVRPQVEVERFVSDEEWFDVHTACLTEQDATPWQDGTRTMEQAVADYVCSIRYPGAWVEQSVLSIEERAVIYDYAVNVLQPCVRSAGYVPGPMISRREFMVNYFQYGWFPWPEPAWGNAPEYYYAPPAHNNDLWLRCPMFPAGWEER